MLLPRIVGRQSADFIAIQLQSTARGFMRCEIGCFSRDNKATLIRLFLAQVEEHRIQVFQNEMRVGNPALVILLADYFSVRQNSDARQCAQSRSQGSY